MRRAEVAEHRGRAQAVEKLPRVCQQIPKKVEDGKYYKAVINT